MTVNGAGCRSCPLEGFGIRITEPSVLLPRCQLAHYFVTLSCHIYTTFSSRQQASDSCTQMSHWVQVLIF
jgi:hypothetical protein